MHDFYMFLFFSTKECVLHVYFHVFLGMFVWVLERIVKNMNPNLASKIHVKIDTWKIKTCKPKSAQQICSNKIQEKHREEVH